MYKVLCYGSFFVFICSLFFAIVYFFKNNIPQVVMYLVKNGGKQYLAENNITVGQSSTTAENPLTFELSDVAERMLSVELKSSKAETKNPIPDMFSVLKDLLDDNQNNK